MSRSLSNKQIALYALLLFLISRGIMVLLYYIYINVTGHYSFEFVFGRWDCEHYVNIAQNGYSFPDAGTGQAIWAFFPLYPLLCRGLFYLTGTALPMFYSCIIVSNICSYLSAFFAVKLFQTYNIKKKRYRDSFQRIFFDDGLILAWFVLFAPFTVYNATAYTESLFVLTIILSFYFMKKRNFVLAGIFAALCSGTRNMGFLLIIPMLIEMYRDFNQTKDKKIGFIWDIIKRPVRLFSLVIIPTGLALYMLYLNFFCGDAFAFKNVQIAWRNDNLFPVIGVLGKFLTDTTNLGTMVGAYMCLGAFAVYVYMFIKGFRSEAAWGVITLLVPLTSHVMSTPRFIAGSFVIWIGTYLLMNTQTKVLKYISFSGLFIAQVVLIILWLMSSPAVM